MQSYQMEVEVLTDTHTHTDPLCGCRSPLFRYLLSLFSAMNKSCFHKVECDRHSLKQTFHSDVSQLPPPQLLPPHAHARASVSLFALYMHTAKENPMLTSNVKLNRHSTKHFLRSVTSERELVWCISRCTRVLN